MAAKPKVLHARRLVMEQLENRLVLACTGMGGTQVECFSSSGPGVPQSAWLPPEAPLHAVEGYTSEAGVGPGDTLELHVSTSPRRATAWRSTDWAGMRAKVADWWPACRTAAAGVSPVWIVAFLVGPRHLGSAGQLARDRIV